MTEVRLGLRANAGQFALLVALNALVGALVGLERSVLMKIDLVGPRRRGLALGLNESAGYVGVAAAAAATGWLAASVDARTVVWVGAAILAPAGLVATFLLVRETLPHVHLEMRTAGALPHRSRRSLPLFAQAGFVNNLNDAVTWGLVPLYLAAHGGSVREIGLVAGLYPLVWGIGQLATGALSDRVGRRPLIFWGMLVQAAAILVLVAGHGGLGSAVVAAVLLGGGTALVYPTLLAAVSDAVAPGDRARATGVYRFWRDSGLVAGALVAGLGADALGSNATLAIVAALTTASGLAFLRDPARTRAEGEARHETERLSLRPSPRGR